MEERKKNYETGKRSSNSENECEETSSKLRKLNEDQDEELFEIARQRSLQSLTYFGVGSQTISSMVFNIVLENIWKLLPGIRLVVLKSVGEMGADKNDELNKKITSAEKTFLTKYYTAISKLVDAYESVLSLYMTLPDGFVLPEELPQIEYKKFLKDQGISDVNIDEHQKKISQIQSEILEEMRKKIKIEIELKQLSTQRKRLTNLQEIIKNFTPKLNNIDEVVKTTFHDKDKLL